MRRLLALVRTELAVRAGGPAGYVAFGFFVLAGMFAPFALGTDEALLERIAPGYLWLVAAIAVLVGLEGLFQDDIQQGRMDQLRLSGLPVWLIVLAMMGVYWLSVCLPLVIAAFPVAWLMTGDVGVLDEDGYLTLQDRSKDVIISGGTNIYPREVEEALLTHPSVHEVSVVGRPSAEWGEDVVAFVVPVPGAGIDPAALDAHCLDEIARFKRPKAYFEIAELPKNNYGKVLKTELRKRLEETT